MMRTIRARRRIALFVAIAGLAGAGSVCARQLIVNPQMLSAPASEEMAAAYPASAAFMMMPGRAVMECSVNVHGRLEACEAAESLPPGLGFDRAVLSLADHIRMQPQLRDGVPTGGARVRMGINFVAPEPEPPAPYAGPAPHARNLALARTFAEVYVSQPWPPEQLQLEGHEGFYWPSFGAPGTRADADEEKMAELRALFDEMRPVHQPQLTEALTLLLARELTYDELVQLNVRRVLPRRLAYYEQDIPAGFEMATASNRLARALRDAYCTRQDCRLR